jgi:hypothetical protein
VPSSTTSTPAPPAARTARTASTTGRAPTGWGSPLSGRFAVATIASNAAIAWSRASDVVDSEVKEFSTWSLCNSTPPDSLAPMSKIQVLCPALTSSTRKRPCSDVSL